MVQALEIEVHISGEVVERVALRPPGPYSIGRSGDCDVVVSDLRISRLHGSTCFANGCWWYEAASPQDGNGVQQSAVPIPVGTSAVVALSADGAVELRLMALMVADATAADPSTSEPAAPLRSVAAPDGDDRVLQTIGRAPESDLVIGELVVSRHHAEVRSRGENIVVVDTDSHLGTFVDGARITEPRTLSPASRVTIGSSVLKLDGRRLAASAAETAAPALQADHLTVTVGDGLRLIDDISFTVPHGQLVAVVGPTGAGKSTLLKAITGFLPPDSGEVFVAGRSLYQNFDEVRNTLGYVPQEDILHPQLSVRRALRFGAELRFPPETTSAERDRRVDEVMAELGLASRAERRDQDGFSVTFVLLIHVGTIARVHGPHR